ncbi:MAG: site-2 protease family protein [Verrucomicrobia subdivision 3 bacterium]|nr:site-2 protease family protein [Limisphaerales bacterium]
MIGALLLNLALLEILVFLCTVLHELGHVAAGQLAGLRVFGVEIGWGRTIADFFTGPLRWQLRAFPFGGVAYATVRSTAAYRLRQSILVLGGPTVNAVLLVISIAAFDSDRWLSASLTQGLSPGMMLFFANASLLAFSLWPHEVSGSYGRIPNDALHLWRIWTQRKSETAHLLIYWYYYEAEHCRRKRDYARAEKWISDGLERFPNNFFLLCERLAILDDQRDYRAGLELSEKLLSRCAEHAGIEPILLSNLAYFCALTGDPKLIERADEASKRGLEEMPWIPGVKGTRGAVLLKLGRFEEALQLLREALAAHKERADGATCACWLAKGYLALNEPAEVRRYLALARRLDPHCSLIDTVGERVGAPHSGNSPLRD